LVRNSGEDNGVSREIFFSAARTLFSTGRPMKLSNKSLASEILQSNRYKVLFLIHERGKIELTEGTKTRLKNTFGYSSDGAFYNDLKFFKDKELVREDDKWIRITPKGRRELFIVTGPLVSGVVSALYALIFLLSKWTSPSGLSSIIAALSPWLTGFLPVVIIAFFNFYLYLILRPRLSAEERAFR